MSGGCDVCGVPYDLHDEVELANCRAALRREEARERAEDAEVEE